MSNVNVGSATVTTIVNANTRRISLIIINTHSSADLYLDSSSSLTTVTAGMIIPAGGNFTEDSGGDKVYQGPFYGLSGENVVDVRYWERTR